MDLLEDDRWANRVYNILKYVRLKIKWSDYTVTRNVYKLALYLEHRRIDPHKVSFLFVLSTRFCLYCQLVFVCNVNSFLFVLSTRFCLYYQLVFVCIINSFCCIVNSFCLYRMIH